MDLFQTLHTSCGHNEDVHVGFDGARIDFDRITAFELSNFRQFLHYRVLRLRNQFLSQFYVDLFQTLHTCCGHHEDVYVGFWWS